MIAIGRIPTKEEAEQSFARHHTIKGLVEDFGLTYKRARKVAKEYDFPVCKTGTQKKATTEQLIDSYCRTGSVKKVASEFGMCPQTVYERLVKIGVVKKIHVMSDEEREALIDLYQSGVLRGDGKIKAFCGKFRRTPQYVSRHARALGLTSKNRKSTAEYVMELKKRVSAWFKTHEHPRGMLGKKHTKEVLTALRKISKAHWENMTEEERHQAVVKSLNGRILKRGRLPHNKKHGSWKSDWRTIGGKKTYYRSRWEANYARYLEFLREAGKIANWLHEPTTFLFVKEQCSYLPDFLVTLTNGEIEYHEVKGWMDDRSSTKISLMRKYHPDKKLVLIRRKEYEDIERIYSDKIPGWEFKERKRKGDQ